MAACTNKVTVGYDWRKDKPIEVTCGSTDPDGNLALCDTCITKYQKRYPQGWRYTPGDVCRHGTYIGDSCGADIMCGACESGE